MCPLPKEKLKNKVSDYLTSLRTIQREKKIRQPLDLSATCEKIMKQVPRRAISLHADSIQYQFAVWDLRKTKAMTFRQIAETLWDLLPLLGQISAQKYRGLRTAIAKPKNLSIRLPKTPTFFLHRRA